MLYCVFSPITKVKNCRIFIDFISGLWLTQSRASISVLKSLYPLALCCYDVECCTILPFSRGLFRWLQGSLNNILTYLIAHFLSNPPASHQSQWLAVSIVLYSKYTVVFLGFHRRCHFFHPSKMFNCGLRFCFSYTSIHIHLLSIRPWWIPRVDTCWPICLSICLNDKLRILFHRKTECHRVEIFFHSRLHYPTSSKTSGI